MSKFLSKDKMTYLWGELKKKFAPLIHQHNISDINNFPNSLPANGGNADTIDGHHASAFATMKQGINIVTQTNLNVFKT